MSTALTPDEHEDSDEPGSSPHAPARKRMRLNMNPNPDNATDFATPGPSNAHNLRQSSQHNGHELRPRSHHESGPLDDDIGSSGALGEGSRQGSGAHGGKVGNNGVLGGKLRAYNERCGPDDSLKTTEMLLLMQQALEQLGFSSISEDLAQATGLQHNVPTLKQFSAAILDGSLEEGLRVFEISIRSHLSQQTAQLVKIMMVEEQYLEVILTLT